MERYSHKPRNIWSLQVLEEAKGDPLEPLEGAQPCWYLGFRHLASRIVRINSCCFKPPADCHLSWWPQGTNTPPLDKPSVPFRVPLLKRNRTLWSMPPMSSACLLFVEKLLPRISLIREVRQCRNKGKQSKGTK